MSFIAIKALKHSIETASRQLALGLSQKFVGQFSPAKGSIGCCIVESFIHIPIILDGFNVPLQCINYPTGRLYGSMALVASINDSLYAIYTFWVIPGRLVDYHAAFFAKLTHFGHILIRTHFAISDCSK